MDVIFEHLKFVEAGSNLDLTLVGKYNFLLVALSIIVAWLAAYSALRIVDRVNASPTPSIKFLWVATGATTMGIGVWAMHFIGMLAFILPVPISYDPFITLYSVVPAILASGVMLYIISRRHVSIWVLLAGGTLTGLGIGRMHYFGMAAMHMNATLLYDFPIYMASVVLAIVLATVALYTKFLIDRRVKVGQQWAHLGAALIMGGAIAGMHYIRMSAAYFFPGTHEHTSQMLEIALNPLWLGAWVTLITVLIIGITIFITMMDQRLENSRIHGVKLELLVAERTQALQKTNDQLQSELEQRRQTQEALKLAKEEAEAETQAKAEFLANMSHEIRTPLNAIVGMTELLLDTPLVAEQRDFTGTIRTSSESLLNVINDILDFSKIEARKLELEAQPLDLRRCVEEALDMLMVKASEKRLELAFLTENEVPTTILGDITRLRQIVINLLNNAIKFTDTGEVVVTVTSRPLSELQTVGAQEGDAPDTLQTMPWCELHFTVRDTGIGIAPEHMDRLFKSFSQVDVSTTRKYGGTGLGLLISQRLSELMGGRMWAESEGVGHGTTFHFTLQAQVLADELPVMPENTSTALVGKRGLVVDDNDISQLIIANQLAAWGIEACTTASPDEALQWLAQGEEFDFAILDLYMPAMDGFTLARQVRQYPTGATLPLIMLSSHGNRAVHAEAETLNFAALLAKPLKQAQLGNVLMEILANRARSQQPKTHTSGFDPLLAERMPLRILLAEDNLVNQKVAQHILARLGYQTEIVNNGLEAVQAVQRQRYDVVLMDVQMPELDGLEATRAIVAEFPPTQRPYIIAMTAHALTGDEAMCIDAGMNAFVSKPIQIEKLVDALKQSQQVREPALA